MKIPMQIELAETVIGWMINFVAQYGNREFITEYEKRGIENFIYDRQDLLDGKETALEKEVDKTFIEYDEKHEAAYSDADEINRKEMQDEYIGILRGLKDLRMLIQEEADGKYPKTTQILFHAAHGGLF